MITNFIATVDRYGIETPDRVVYDYQGISYTYGQLKHKSDALARHLQTLELVDKAPIMVFGGHEFEMLVAFLASVKTGHAYIPIDTHSSDDRIKTISEVATPAAVIEVTPLPVALELPHISLEDVDWDQQAYDARQQVTGDENYYIIFTSGTTGVPKGVQISHDNLLSFTNWMVNDFGLPDQPSFLAQAPYSFDLSVMSWAPSLALGGCLKAIPKAEADDFARLFARLGEIELNVWVSTPSFADVALLSPEFKGDLLPALSHFIFCGEELTVATAQKLLERFPNAKVYNTYGPTEATVAVSKIEITPDIVKAAKRLPIGYAQPDVTLTIEDGEIVITGRPVSKGYLNNPEKTAAAFKSGSYYTGDLGSLASDGLLQYGGRKDFQIKLHGYRIELEEVNHFLNLSQYVKSGVAVPKYDANHKVSAMIAYVVAEQHEFDKPLELTKAIKSELQDMMMPYMVPQRFKYVDSLPISPNGKIDIKAVIAEVNS